LFVFFFLSFVRFLFYPLGITYGRNDINGWCDIPGALCCWNVFSKTFNSSVPDLVLDHPSCLMCLAFHPVIPSIVVLGSYNGEIIIWDLLNTEKPVAISPVIEYSHKEPVIDLKWVKATSRSSAAGADSSNNLNELSSWNIVSCGIDGRILYWSLSNKLAHPIKGYLLSQGKASSRRQFPTSHSATALTLSSLSYLPSNSSTQVNRDSFLPKWMLIGEGNGEILRCQVSRLPNQFISPVSISVCGLLFCV
jgi:WD40 repeat protein